MSKMGKRKPEKKKKSKEGRRRAGVAA